MYLCMYVNKYVRQNWNLNYLESICELPSSFFMYCFTLIPSSPSSSSSTSSSSFVVASQRIVKAINEKRVQLSDVWNNVLSYESGELKRRVDPLRTVDLSPYLSVAPWVGGVCYLAAIFVQQVYIVGNQSRLGQTEVSSIVDISCLSSQVTFQGSL